VVLNGYQKPAINNRLATFMGIVLCVAFVGFSVGRINASTPNLVTADIQAGIEKYIEEEASRGEGYFKFSSKGKEYKFKLVRVHTEYLAKLGPRRHFACVDLVDTKGDVYDVDFFLSGDPGAMTVTETTIHKLNGIPFYAWDQNEEGVWVRVPMEDATQQMLGVITGVDEFEFIYTVNLPEIKDTARMWLPAPSTDAFQTVEITNIDSLKNYQILSEAKHGNKIFLFDLTAEDSEKSIDIHYSVKRFEKSAYVPKTNDWKNNIKADRLVPIGGRFKGIANKIVKDKKGDLVRARAIYDHVIDEMRYAKVGSGWGKGDAVFACSLLRGNCTDFHSYFISLARTVGIPARFAIGASIPSSREDGGLSGYHCWAEFYAEGKWWPVDISEANKYPSLSTYYFGHNPANRFEFSRGRDLVVEPGPKSGLINFLAYPVLEVGGNPTVVKAKFSFNRKVMIK